MALIDKPELAWRKARAIASDVACYNEKKVVEGIENDDIFARLENEIEEGREHYRGLVTTELFDRTNYYDRAIVDVVIRSKGHIKSKIW